MRFLCAMHVFEVGASSSSLGYTCAKFDFFRDHHCWASPWRKIAYSLLNHSLTHSITQLIWCPGNRSFCFEIRTIATSIMYNGWQSTIIYINEHPMGCEAQLAWRCLFTPTFWQTILTHKLGRTDLVLACDQGMQDYKSLCTVVTICSTQVNIQTHIWTDTQTDRISPAYMKSSAS